jgi:hypothetical protein
MHKTDQQFYIQKAQFVNNTPKTEDHRNKTLTTSNLKHNANEKFDIYMELNNLKKSKFM